MLVVFPAFCFNESVRLLQSVTGASLLLLCFVLLPESGVSAVQASITIDQLSGKNVGTWTLISTDGSSRSSSETGIDQRHYSLALSQFGPATLSVAIPQGMSVKISVYRGGELVTSVDTPQYSFNLFPNDTYRFIIQYSLSRLGSLGVTSIPSGVRFRLKGESGRTYTKKTPFTFKNLPAGQYSVQLSSFKDCLQPAPQSALIVPEERSTINVTMNCDKPPEAVTVDDSRPTKRALMEYARDRELKKRGERK